MKLLGMAVSVAWLVLVGAAYAALFLFPGPDNPWSRAPVPPDLSRAARQPSAFVGFEDPIIEYYDVTTIDTEANRKAMPDADRSRWVSTDSLADVIQFLLSERARDISGASIPVYGRDGV